ncbi:endodeoxyribonuclease [Mortierella claussenii]|nr:endodeoxyribonuclease [Mortierella claussenii]
MQRSTHSDLDTVDFGQMHNYEDCHPQRVSSSRWTDFQPAIQSELDIKFSDELSEQDDEQGTNDDDDDDMEDDQCLVNDIDLYSEEESREVYGQRWHSAAPVASSGTSGLLGEPDVQSLSWDEWGCELEHEHEYEQPSVPGQLSSFLDAMIDMDSDILNHDEDSISDELSVFIVSDGDSLHSEDDEKGLGRCDGHDHDHFSDHSSSSESVNDNIPSSDWSVIADSKYSMEPEHHRLHDYIQEPQPHASSVTMLISQSPSSLYMTTTPRSREWVLERLEALACQFMRDLSLWQEPQIELANRQHMGAVVYDESSGVIRRRQSPDLLTDGHHTLQQSQCLDQESKTGEKMPQWRSFNKIHRLGSSSMAICVMRIVDLVHENICQDTISSKRDLFYRDVQLFRSQRTVDTIVEDLACTLKVPRSCLNVVAGRRSMVYGSVRMTIKVRGKDKNQMPLAQKDHGSAGAETAMRLQGETTKQCSLIDDFEEAKEDVEEDGLDKAFSKSDYNTLLTIPVTLEDILEIEIHSRTRFIMVIEKEATMEHLLSLGFCETHGPCILLTSKGYPDRVARQLLKLMSDMVQSGIHKVPMPYAWSISRSNDMCQVPLSPQLSSLSSPSPRLLNIPLLALMDCDPHGMEIYLTYRCGSIRSAYENSHLAVPALQCLGQVPSDWEGWFQRGRMDPFERHLMPLTLWDRRKLVKLLTQHPYVQRHQGWKRQISRMLMMNRKSELQSLCVLAKEKEEEIIRCSGQQGQEENMRSVIQKDDDDDETEYGKDVTHALLQYLEMKLQDPNPWAKHHAWRNSTLFTRSARIRSMFPGLGIASVAFAAYLGYEYITAPKADAHHGEAHH